MDIVVERGAGLDVHKKAVVVTVETPDFRETRTFGTTTVRLREMAQWLESLGVTHIAMESTGPYWKPIYNVLEEFSFEILVCNAHHIKAVPGRKTDVKDSAWICSLLRHGLLRPSFIPSKEQRELRELVRYRKSLIRERANEINRIQKVLEGANIKLASVATDIMGVSGRKILQAMIAGFTNAGELAEMAKGRLQEKKDELEEALVGIIGPHQRLILREQLGHIDDLDARIERLSQEVNQRMRPFSEALDHLDTIPGIGRQTAETIVAEIGVDMSRFPSAAHLASWAGLCPGNNESAGKRKSGRTRKGSPALRETLVEAARAASRTKATYLNAQYHRIAARRGAKRAAVAVAHSLIVITYHILQRGTTYQDLGFDYFDRKNKETVARRLTHRLEAMGFRVTIEEAA
ncbi:MAG: IS110 family transposase [Candidatus Parvarchaeota archaeon]